MSAVSQLIDVSYKDMTNYTEDTGGDVLGVPFNHHWGPVGKLDVLTQAEFFSRYPEVVPFKSYGFALSDYYAYAQIKKAFECGIASVEAYRAPGIWKYFNLAVVPGAAAEAGKLVSNTSVEQFSKGTATTSNFVISTKYPGVPPSDLIGDCDTVALKVEFKGTIAKVTVSALTEAPSGTVTISGKKYTERIIEEWEGSTDSAATEDGRSVFLPTLLQDSNLISASVSDFVSSTTEISAYSLIDFSTIKVDETHDWSKDLDKFDDTMLSSATLLISPLNNASLNTKIIQIAKARQDLNGVIGYDVSSVFSKDSILEYLESISSVRDKFTVFVAGRESVNVFGYKVISNCIGGWCGHTASVAKSVRVNQLASAFTYGGYYGTLVSTLTFDEVCELHELGVISVFASNRGPLIWGIRSLHKTQTSYFGKANVMRVLARILRNVFPVCLNIIHTDAAANPITRSQYHNTFNSIINSEISEQNLASDSYADCMGDINSDVKTKGGKIFNLMLVLHFYGLVEKLKVAVVATDSSVTAQIV